MDTISAQARTGKRVLWIDDSAEVLAAAERMLAPLSGLTLLTAQSSEAAEAILREVEIHAVITDILRRNLDRSVAQDDGYRFFTSFIRPNWKRLPVLFHTKNLPSSFAVDEHSQYISKWDSEAKKSVELEFRLYEAVQLYEAFADLQIWERIEPRLVIVEAALLERLRSVEDALRLSAHDFERLVAEVLDRQGFDVMWVPGGNDQGIDIVAGSRMGDYLIDVKRYAGSNPVQVDLVRHVYGVAAAVSQQRGASPPVYGGIITSSRFTAGAEAFRNASRPRPLLRDWDWLSAELRRYAPRIRTTTKGGAPLRQR